MDKKAERALRAELAATKSELENVLYDHQRGMFERGESEYDPDADRRASNRLAESVGQNGRLNKPERRHQKSLGQMIDHLERIPPDDEYPGRDALGRFAKGHTGNPLGRPPNLKFMKAEPSVFLNTLVDMKVDGKTVQVPREEALMTRLFADAMNGRAWAQRALLGIADKKREGTAAMQLVAQDLADRYDDPDAPPMSQKDIRTTRRLLEIQTLGRHPQLRRENMDVKRSVRRQRKKERDAAAAARRPRRRRAAPPSDE